jgi:hypothetical protein
MSAPTSRRRFLKYLGSSAALTGVTACGGSDDAPATRVESTPGAEPAEAQPSVPATARLTPLTDDDPQALALAYVSDASKIDRKAQPRFEPGQACGNCALFMGAEDAESGPCSIFPGRLVAATGWCSVYAAKGS